MACTDLHFRCTLSASKVPCLFTFLSFLLGLIIDITYTRWCMIIATDFNLFSQNSVNCSFFALVCFILAPFVTFMEKFFLAF